ncbi:XPG domain containing protein [Nitzschia inconspicua]|uniref:XPG domain containing protein n=1 Tax=Nitzschia inconspicua TaxID=303405 RepID=A0A9K3LGU4_9STRA|nr:XPG domain containing protein [Nitzschia inconspicua]
MGVSDVLPKILESSGRTIDLRDLQAGVCTVSATATMNSNSNSNRSVRPLRIGIDVHSWIYTAGYAFSDRLGDARHLTNYGRADLIQQQQQEQEKRQNGPSEEDVQQYVMACTQYVMKRLQTLQDTTNARLLVVLDGKSPPIKRREVQRRRKVTQEHNRLRHDPTVALGSPGTIQAANERRTIANKRAGPGPYLPRILDSLAEALRGTALNNKDHYDHDQDRCISFLVAPYEADAQLAYLARQRYIDLIITEDSDLLAHGAPFILYKSLSHISNDSIPAGILWQKSDVGALPLGYSTAGPVECDRLNLPGTTKTSLSSSWSNKSTIDLMDFTPAMLATLFVLLGCDYTVGGIPGDDQTKKLKGIGLVTAHKIVRNAFLGHPQGSTTTQSTSTSGRLSPLSRVWEEAYKHSYVDNEKLTMEFKQEYQRIFMEALLMYRHPVVFDPLLQRCIHINQKVGLGGRPVLIGDTELMEHRPYAKLCRDFDKVTRIVGDLPPAEKAVGIAEGRIDWRGKSATPFGQDATATTTTSPPPPSLKRKRHETDTEGIIRERPVNLLGGANHTSTTSMDDSDLQKNVMSIDFDESEQEEEGANDEEHEVDYDTDDNEAVEEDARNKLKHTPNAKPDDENIEGANEDIEGANEVADKAIGNNMSTDGDGGTKSATEPDDVETGGRERTFVNIARKLFPFPSSTEKLSPPLMGSQETFLYEAETTAFQITSQESVSESQSPLFTQEYLMTQEDRTETNTLSATGTTSAQKLRRAKRERISSPDDHTILSVGRSTSDRTTPAKDPSSRDDDSDATIPMSLEKRTTDML